MHHHQCNHHVNNDTVEPDHNISDVTLRSCCERELEEQRRIEGYKQTLLRQDPTSLRQNIASRAIVRDENRLIELSRQSSSSLDDDDDDILELLRRQRIQEIQDSVLNRQAHSTVIECEDHTLMATLHEDTVTETICCLIKPQFTRKNDLLEYIMSIADRHGQYRFVTCCLQEYSSMPAALGQANPSLHTVILLLCKNVVVASVTVLDDDAWGEIHIEESILSCIKSHTCVEVDCKSSSASESDHDEPCSTCGRKYPHEHV